MKEANDEGAHQEGDRAPADATILQGDREQRDGEPRERQPDPEGRPAHRWRNRAIAARKSGVWRATALTRAPSATPSSMLMPSSW